MLATAGVSATDASVVESAVVVVGTFVKEAFSSSYLAFTVSKFFLANCCALFQGYM